jgi:hypothetical protein
MLYELSTTVNFELFSRNIEEDDFINMASSSEFLSPDVIVQESGDGYTIIDKSGTTTFYFDEQKRDEKINHILENSVNSKLFQAIHAPEQKNLKRIYVV